MKTYSLEVRNCVTIEVEANDPEEARMMLVDNHELWKEDLCEDAYISDANVLSGEVKDES